MWEMVWLGGFFGKFKLMDYIWYRLIDNKHTPKTLLTQICRMIKVLTDSVTMTRV